MSFTRDDLTAYETKPQVEVAGHDPFNPTSTTPEVKSPEANPKAKEEAEVDAAITASVTESAEQDANDGSTTETKAETVAADDANPEGESSETDELSNDGKSGRSRAQERIEELVAERNALRKYGEYLLSQVDELRKVPKGTQATTPAQAPQAETKEDPMPTLESAEYDPVKLTKLQNEWIQRQVNSQVKQAVQQFETRQSEQATRQAFESKVVEFRKQAPDFDLVISNPALPELAKETARVVVKSENGPAIVYHLAKNPDLAARIARLDTTSQAAAIGRLEEQLIRTKVEAATTKEPSKTVTKAPVKVTQAPPPPKPVQASAPPSKDEGIMSMDEWVANERAKKLKQKTDRLAIRKAFR